MEHQARHSEPQPAQRPRQLKGWFLRYRQSRRPEGFGFFSTRLGIAAAILGPSVLIGGVRNLFRSDTALDWFGSLAAVVGGLLVTAWICLYLSRPVSHDD